MKKSNKSLVELKSELTQWNSFFLDTVEELDNFSTKRDDILKLIKNPNITGIPYDIVWVCPIQYKNGKICNNKIIPAFITNDNIDHSLYPNREKYSLIGINTYERIKKFSDTLHINENDISSKTLAKKHIDLSFNVRFDWITLNVYNNTELKFVETQLSNAKIFAVYEVAESYRNSFISYYKEYKKIHKEGTFTIQEIAEALHIDPKVLKIIKSSENPECIFDGNNI